MRIIDILENEAWVRSYPFIDDFVKSDYFEILKDSYKRLNTHILFDSHIHGQDHIERVIFFAHLLAFHYKLDQRDTDVLRNAASLHDTKRVNDGWDTEHGHRAALESISYSYADKADDRVIQAVIAAHSTDDKIMDETIREFIKDTDDFERTKRLAKLFKDADGLDRVRINHLDPAYLRNDFSKDLVDFAYDLYDRF
ncbi:HD domain-containing protein [Anaerococcus degeneri]|uniref:HD domain-containing protein n=1 Tax=Anaerococcus degeneri TaxID=361500 RepID=A0ABS7YVY1_9FIRM|nr:hypothetical protein [Anaerococcus degeneri]MBP2015533.1 uncharacterized protein [Anaerococcus degeneri]MCA2095889.1 hypothetical protein [Anaerococcus degeneri]